MGRFATEGNLSRPIDGSYRTKCVKQNTESSAKVHQDASQVHQGAYKCIKVHISARLTSKTVMDDQEYQIFRNSFNTKIYYCIL